MWRTAVRRALARLLSPAATFLGGGGPIMARHEQDREDLIREATALIDRCELVDLSGGDPWVVGVRAGGAVSIYLGSDPVYHFNSAGQLRRAFVDGELWTAERGRLVRLARRRT